ncbi:MAG: MopE-related protein, partial [Myxococcales bacterium]|nr:MopE-related protein [Myxococcales bacterium]
DSGTAPAQELCGGGYTPLTGTLKAAKEYFEGTFGGFDAPTENDGQAECRNLNVILMTDGRELCSATEPPTGADPVGAAMGLRTTMVPSPDGAMSKTIPTYVIGFGINPGDQQIEDIAMGGGTDAPGDHRGFYPDNQQELATALSEIIADAQPPQEICNEIDDDCDGVADEGITKFCNLPEGITDKTECTEPDETNCDGVDDDCDGLIDEGLLARDQLRRRGR